MVTIQDIGLQLTKPVKELAEWNFPFSQTLEKYYSLFNATYNKSFGEAGLVLQNSTAVYIHRVDSLWNKIEYFRDIFSTYEPEEITKHATKKKDRRSDVRSQEFRTNNFAAEVEKNIDIKKSHTIYDNVKSKSRRFTQLEKGIAQQISIDIYDVNGEIIGKKYDFRCNQNISMDGVLVDEFAPQDFCCRSNSVQEKSPSSLNHSYTESLESSFDTLIDSTVHDDDNENEEDLLNHSELVSSFEQRLNQDLSLSRNTDNTLMETSMNTLSDNCHDANLTSNEIYPNTPTTINSPIVSTIDISPNDKNLNTACINQNIKENLNACSLLDSPPESIYSKGRRTSSIDDTTLQNDANEDQSKTKLYIDSTQSTPLNRNKRNKTRRRSSIKSTPKSFKQKLLTPTKRKRNITKKILAHIFEESNSSHTGFRLHANTESDANDDVMTTSNEDRNSELYSPEPAETSPLMHKGNFYDSWFRSSNFLPENVDRWHELMQPKLREAEQRSTFCIRDYASRIIDTLKTSRQRRINFDTVIQTERACEVARYFLASLDLASKQRVDISTDRNLEHNIEIRLPEEDGQCSSNDQADSCD